MSDVMFYSKAENYSGNDLNYSLFAGDAAGIIKAIVEDITHLNTSESELGSRLSGNTNCNLGRCCFNESALLKGGTYNIYICKCVHIIYPPVLL